MENEEAMRLLHAASYWGDMDVLREFLAGWPVEVFFTLSPTEGRNYNLIQRAVVHLQEEFLRELITKLPPAAVDFLITQQDATSYKLTALHYAVSRGDTEILRLLLNFYRTLPTSSASSTSSPVGKPWLVGDAKGVSPLLLAVMEKREEFALEIMSMDMELLCNVVSDTGISLLLEAVRRGCCQVALQILTSPHSYSTSGDRELTPLDLAPNSNDEVCKLLLEKHPEMIKKSDKNGVRFLHLWVMIGHVWPFHILLQQEPTSGWRQDFLDLMCAVELGAGNNPLHLAAEQCSDQTVQIVQLLIEAYIEFYQIEREVSRLSPWRRENSAGFTPLMLALKSKNEELALYLMSLDFDTLVLFERRSALFHAVFYGCDKSVEKMLSLITLQILRDVNSRVQYSDDGQNVLHAASNCTERTANLLMDKMPWLINEPDRNEMRPIDTASEVGTAWLIELLLKRDPSAITNAPYAWTYSCKNGHLAAISAFINHCPDFKKLCLQLKDTPLHHIKLRTYKEYNEFMAITIIEEMKNVVNMEGETPLHRAIRCKDILFTEVALTTGVSRNIPDKLGKTATDLLAELCDQDSAWDAMCKRIGINPRLRTFYIQPTNHNIGRTSTDGFSTSLSSSPGEMRSTLSVVAALLATLTFAAGFTLPGGNNDTGNAILSDKAPFIVFILADTYAMCSAMLVLFCLMWSMVCDHDKSLLLIDRAVVILMQSLYGTLLTFMTGVYTVISNQSLWAAILVFVMCSLVAISANRTILYKLLDKLIPSADIKKTENHARSLEEGAVLATTYIDRDDNKSR